MELAAGIQRLLQTRELGRALFVHEVLPSTNDEALRLARGGAVHGTVVVAEQQTAGRGRRGRGWSSPPGVNLYLSLVLRPALAPQRAPELVPTLAVAAAETLRAAGADAGIKWPNDLEIDGRKAGGILTELSASGERIQFVVAGLGLNVNVEPADLPEEVRERATSLRIAIGHAVSRPALVADLLARIEGWLDLHQRAGFAPVRARYRELSVTLGRRVRLIEDEATVEGVAEDIDESGALLLRRDDGVLERARTGDVTSLRLAR